MASKWRLTKKEEKEVETFAAAAKQRVLDEGGTNAEAKNSFEDARAQKTKELKEAKASASAAKKAAAEKSGKSTPPSIAGPPAGPPAVAALRGVAAHAGVNQPYYEAILGACQTVLSHPTFGLIASEGPRDITGDLAKDSGCQDVWTPDKCRTACGREGCYRAAINFWWLDFLANPTPSVPLSLERARKWAEVYFKQGPRHLKEPVEIAIDHADYALDTCKGKWVMVSPPEVVHGILLMLADRVNKAQDPELLQWKGVLLSTPAVVTVYTGSEERYWASYDARQVVCQTADSCKRTARQTAYEIVYFRDNIVSLPDISIPELQELYCTKGNAESTTREFSDNFVKDSLTIHDKILVDDQCSAVLDLLESKYGSLDNCLNSTTKLKIVVDRTDGWEVRRWVLNGIADALQANMLQNDQLGKTWFTGGSNSVSGIDLIKFRKLVLEMLLRQELPKRGFELKDLQLIGEKILCHDYRKYVSALPDGASPETQWQATLKKSSQTCLKLLEDLGYGSALNGSLVAVLRKGKGVSPMELLDIEAISTRLDNAKQQLDDEICAEKALLGGTVVDEPETTEVEKLSRGSIPAEPSRYQRGSAEHFTATACQMFNVYCSLYAEPDTQAGVAALVSQSSLSGSSATGVPGKSLVMIHLDAALVGESRSRPWQRQPAVAPALVSKLIHGALVGRGAQPVKSATEPDMPIGGDAVFLCDSGRPEVEAALLGPFSQNSARGNLSSYLEHTRITMCISQQALTEKKKVARGMLNQVMTLHVIGNDPWAKMVPERKHTKYPGTNRGNVLGWVGQPTSADTWMSSYENKKVVYGGKIFGTVESNQEEEERKKSTEQEPVFFHFLPQSLYDNNLSSYSVVAVLDLTAGQGELCKAALEKRVPYVGLCLTEQHAVQLKAELISWLKGRMCTEGSTYYSPEWTRAAGADLAEQTKTQPKAKATRTKPKKPTQQTIEAEDDTEEEEEEEAEPEPTRKKQKKTDSKAKSKSTKRKLVPSDEDD
ncbi:unnamed protein product [Symbiodinium sp. CCMP2592]|nr:unnamed protein product [Symbiodinium sp. CCMP2592]